MRLRDLLPPFIAAVAVGFSVGLLVLVLISPACAAASEGEPVRIMAVGDSITYGVGDQLLNGYRADLKNRLTYSGFPIEYVGGQETGAIGSSHHEGHRGWRINQVRAEIYNWLMLYRPDVVLIHLGTNDIGADDTLSAAPARVNALVNQIKVYAPDTEVFVMQIVGFADPAKQAKANTFNAGLARMSWLADPSVHLVNQGGVRGDMLYDGVHPNSYGYSQMGWNIYQSFRSVYSGNTWYAGQSPSTKATATVCKRGSDRLPHCASVANAQRNP